MRKMKNKTTIEKRIRGWLPKEHPIVLAQKMSKPIWWRPLWLSIMVLTLASGILAFFALRIPLQQVIIWTGIAFVCIGIGYYIRVRPSFKVNRALYVLLGVTPFGFVVSVVYAVFLGRYVTGWLMG